MPLCKQEKCFYSPHCPSLCFRAFLLTKNNPQDEMFAVVPKALVD
jgi:hypothetical protein